MKNKYLNIEQIKYLPESIKAAADKTEHIIKSSDQRSLEEISVITDGVAQPISQNPGDSPTVRDKATTGGPCPRLYTRDSGQPRAGVHSPLAYETLKTGEAFPLASLAPIIISLLPTQMEKAPEAFRQIRKFIAGGGDLTNYTSSGYNPRALSLEPLPGVYGEALSLATLAPIIISLLPTIIEKVSDAIDGIKRVLSGSGI